MTDDLNISVITEKQFVKNCINNNAESIIALEGKIEMMMAEIKALKEAQ